MSAGSSKNGGGGGGSPIIDATTICVYASMCLRKHGRGKQQAAHKNLWQSANQVDFLEHFIYNFFPKEQTLYDGSSALTTMAAPRITLIGIYFGRLPFYAPLFFKSAGANAGIDFFVITDRYPPCALPPNVRLLRINRTAFERLASEKLGHAMRLDSPRKLCDYKPAYGRIFSDYLRRSDYWGHIDFDIVWGNIPRFLHPAVEEGYEIISADGKRISGPCTIYKNTHRLRELFREIPDVVAKLNSPKSFDLDERDFDRVVKSSGLSLLNRSFYSRRDIPFAEFRTFLTDADSDLGDAVYRRILKGHELTASTGRRLPAVWRDGDIWNCLPCGKPGHVRLLNGLFLHLTTAKVSFSIDFKNNLILPRVRQPKLTTASN